MLVRTADAQGCHLCTRPRVLHSWMLNSFTVTPWVPEVLAGAPVKIRPTAGFKAIGGHVLRGSCRTVRDCFARVMATKASRSRSAVASCLTVLFRVVSGVGSYCAFSPLKSVVLSAGPRSTGLPDPAT